MVEVESDDKHLGTSPANMVATTVGDELKNAGYPSEGISIALKGSGGDAYGSDKDLSLWSTRSYTMGMSRFYFPDGKLPKWVESLNADIKSRKGTTVSKAFGVQPAFRFDNALLRPHP